jgi:hypothetical protein
LKTGINVFLRKPISLDWLLKLLHLDFVNLDDAELLPYDGYFIFYVTPIFNSTTAISTLSETSTNYGIGDICASNQTIFTED